MGWVTDLNGQTVGVDTSPFIYFIEEHPRYLPIVGPVFEAIGDGRLEAVTSAVTLLEVLVVPDREQDEALAARYEAILGGSRGLHLIELSQPLLRAAARLRASTSMKIPDAIQVAAALSTGCPVLDSNDDRCPPRIGGLRILRIDDYLA